MKTPIQAFVERGVASPEDIALIVGNEQWTNARLYSAILRWISLFRTLGIGEGDRVVVQLDQCPEAVLAIMSCFSLGAIVCPLNVRLNDADLLDRMKILSPALYLGDASQVAFLNSLNEETLPSFHRITTEGADTASASNLHNSIASGDGFTISEESSDNIIALLETSGTTGRPKFVSYTRGMLAAFEQSAALRDFRSDDVVPCTTPLFHASGFTCLCFCLLLGTTLVLIPEVSADKVLDALERNNATYLYALPFFCAALVRRQLLTPRKIGSLRKCIVVGDVCSPSIEEDFLKVFNRPLFSLWGSTEEPGAAGPGRSPGPTFTIPPSAGFKLLDEQGAEVPLRIGGRMHLRCPTTTPGYWVNSSQFEPLVDGWFDTGDLVRQEPDGQIRYLGRTKDVLIRGDVMISPVEIETAVRSMAGVLDAGLTGIPDTELGQRFFMALVGRPQTAAGLLSSVSSQLRSSLDENKMPDFIALVSEIPRSPLGKIDRVRLQELVLHAPESEVLRLRKE